MRPTMLAICALATLAPISDARAFESDIGPGQSLDGTPHYIPDGGDTLFGTPGYRGGGRLGSSNTRADRDWRYAAPTSKSNPNTARPDNPSTYPKYDLYTGR